LNDNGHSVDEVPITRVYDWRQIDRITELIRKNGIDLLHTNGYRSDILGYLASRRVDIPIVSTVHGVPKATHRATLKANALMHFWMRALKRFDTVIAVSESLREQLAGRGVDPDKIKMLRNAVAFSGQRRTSPDGGIRKEMGLNPNARVIGTVGRLSPEKGHEYFIRALPHVLKHHGEVKCLIVGDGPQMETLKALSAQLCPKGIVEFLGYREDVHAIYQALDVFVLPSLTEGTPMALLEAMGASVPVVVTAVGGVPEIIRDDVNGIVVPPANAEKLAEGILKALGSEAKTAKMTEENFNLLRKEFDISNWIKEIESIYGSALSRRGVDAAQTRVVADL
jgi:glycosyltransferase involved in cell wall biosynthesis